MHVLRPIILEGPDGAGKSTLGVQLAKDLGRIYLHTGGAAHTQPELMQRCMDFICLADQKNLVFDRCPFISDPIYKKALKLNQLIDPEVLSSSLCLLNPVIIYCQRQTAQQMLESIDYRDKPHKSPEYKAKVVTNHRAIVYEYDRKVQFLRSRGFTILDYDWSIDDYSILLEMVKKCVA
jgi:hypothetical protein